MTDIETLKLTLEKLGISDRLNEVLEKRIKFGPTTTFDEDGNLQRLDLSNMGIENLPNDTFEGLTKLTELKIFKNNISSLPDDVFDPIPNLTELHLKDNKISTLKIRHFQELEKLNRLFLMGNPLPEGLAKIYPNTSEVTKFLDELKKLE